jgi:hypothetical protein
MNKIVLKHLFSAVVLLLAVITGQAQTVDVFIFDNDGQFTNVRNSPSGRIVDRIPVDASATLAIERPTNGWWRVVGNRYTAMTNDPDSESDFKVYRLRGSSNGYWIHNSVIAVGTRNYGGQHLKLRAEPNTSSRVTYTIKEEQVVRPIDIRGRWVKVKTLDGRGIGWIDAEWLCGNPLTNCN